MPKGAVHVFCTRLMKYWHFRHHEVHAYFFYSFFQWNINIFGLYGNVHPCADVCSDMGANFCHTSNEILTFLISEVMQLIQNYQYFQGNINCFAVRRFADPFRGRWRSSSFFCARRVCHTSNGFSMILTHVKYPEKGRGENHCFYTGFISKMKSLAYFCLASWVGLKAPFVRDVFSVALKPQRGSK